jgi:hypothetical protein
VQETADYGLARGGQRPKLIALPIGHAGARVVWRDADRLLAGGALRPPMAAGVASGLTQFVVPAVGAGQTVGLPTWHQVDQPPPLGSQGGVAQPFTTGLVALWTS